MSSTRMFSFASSYKSKAAKAILVASALVMFGGLAGCSGGGGSDTAGAGADAIESARGSIELQWQIPEERADGSYLPPEDIAGYVIVYGTEPNRPTEMNYVDNALAESTEITDLEPSSYYFAIATIDIDGLQSDFSGEVEIRYE